MRNRIGEQEITPLRAGQMKLKEPDLPFPSEVSEDGAVEIEDSDEN